MAPAKRAADSPAQLPEGFLRSYRREGGTEGRIVPVLIPETLLQDFDQNGPALPLPPQQGTCHWQARIVVPFASIPWSGLHFLSTRGKETRRRDDSQIGVVGDPLRSYASPVGEASFGDDLQAPGDLSEQMLAVVGSRFLLKHLPILLPQPGDAGPP
jgi:hypothetical protein